GRVFLRIVFEIGVLHDYGVAGRVRETGAQRRALALITLVVNHLVYQRLNLRLDKLARAVGRVVVDDDDLLVGNRGRSHGLHDAFNRGHLVVTGNYDTELHACQGRVTRGGNARAKSSLSNVRLGL